MMSIQIKLLICNMKRQKKSKFPDYINEKVSDGLVFDAEVVIGENFDPDNFYVSTARIMKPDEEKWNTLSVYEMFFI